MKKIILSVAFFAAFYSFGQTTMQEYNYMTNGYIIQDKTGQDINKGYRVEKIRDYSVSDANTKIKRTTEFYKVYNENSTTSKEPIGILLKLRRLDTNQLVYFFMPNKYSQEDVINKAFEDYDKLLKTSNADSLNNHSWNMLRMIAYLN